MASYAKLGPNDPLPTLPGPRATIEVGNAGEYARHSGSPIYHRVEPRSAAWFALRIGKPTASEFHRIVTPGGKLSSQAPGYMCSLLAEMMLGHQVESLSTAYMDRGVELEDRAIAAYEMVQNIETQLGGFVTTDDGLVGCSPDRLVGADGILEMKIPAPHTHVGYLLDSGDLEKDKTPQVQGQLWVCEREWDDLVSWHPELPPVGRRVYRDDKYIGLLKTALDAFVDTLMQARCKLEGLYGKFPQIAIPQLAPPEPEGDFDVSPADVAEMFARGHSVVTMPGIS
jgi:YqaJ-like viral recombinase domain